MTGRQYAVTRFATARTCGPDDAPFAGQIVRFDSWDALCAWWVAAPTRGPAAKNGEAVILGATNPEPATLGPRRAPAELDVLALDVDGFSGEWPALLAWYRDRMPGHVAALVCSTWTHGLPGDKWTAGTSRARVLIPLARPVTAAELAVLSRVVSARLRVDGVQLDDQASTDAARLWYTPRTPSAAHVEPLRIARIEGQPLDPDVWEVRELLALEEGARADKARTAAVREAETHARPDLDPDDTGIADGVDLVALLRDQGFLAYQNASGWRTRCPWGHEHSGKADAADAQLFDTGSGSTWRCFHASCATRTARDVVARFGAGEGAIAGVRVRGVTTEPPRPLDAVRASMRAAATKALEGVEGVRTVLGGGVGTGKTTATLRAVLTLFRPGGPLDDGGGIVWAAPSVALAKRAARDLADLAKTAHERAEISPAHLLRVLDALAGDGGEHASVLEGRRDGTCPALEQYQRADATGPSAGARFCMRQCPHGLGQRDGGEPLCPYFRTRLAAQEQRDTGRPWIVWTTHAGHQSGLGLGDTVAKLDPYATIVDESPLSAMLEPVTFPAALIRTLADVQGVPLDDDQERFVRRLELAAIDRRANAGHVAAVAELGERTTLRVPTYAESKLADLEAGARAAAMHGLTWREIDALAAASGNGWPGLAVSQGRCSVYRVSPWRAGRRLIVLDATATPAIASALGCVYVPGATRYAKGTTVHALSGLAVTKTDLRRSREEDRRASAREELDAIATDAVDRGFLIVMPAAGALWEPDGAPAWFQRAESRGLVTYPNAATARGSNEWKECPGVLSLTWTTPQAARLGFATALQRVAQSNGVTLEADAALREATHQLDVAPLIQAEGRVRPNEHAREIIRCSAPGTRRTPGAAQLLASEADQREAVTVEHAAVYAWRRHGIVPDNRRARALDRCAAVVLRRLADRQAGIVVPHHSEPAIMRVFGVDRGSCRSRHSSIGGTCSTPDPLSEAARLALIQAHASSRSYGPIAALAGLVTVHATTDAGALTVLIDPTQVDPDDERGIAEAVAEAVTCDDTPSPWRYVTIGRARVNLDVDELIGFLVELEEAPTSERHLAAIAGVSRRQAAKVIRRCGGVEPLCRLWREIRATGDLVLLSRREELDDDGGGGVHHQCVHPGVHAPNSARRNRISSSYTCANLYRAEPSPGAVSDNQCASSIRSTVQTPLASRWEVTNQCAFSAARAASEHP